MREKSKAGNLQTKASPTPEAEFLCISDASPATTELLALAEGLKAYCADETVLKAALQDDCLRVRDRLRAAYRNAELMEAIAVASPSLADSFSKWEENPKAKEDKGRSKH